MAQDRMHRDDFLADFKAYGRIVIVGGSLAGLSATETLRADGFSGPSPSLATNPSPLTIARRSPKVF
jgi:hypothetical protein